jgi:tetratricopeptide (TPR) repeat protein
MATRVNKKLLIIVLSCTAIATGVVALVAVQQYRQDPTRFIRAGEAALARNDYKEAARNFGRAIGKRPNELDFHTRYLDATRKIVPASAEEARESYFLYVGSLLRRAQIKRNDPELWREVLEERLYQSELNDSVASWQMLYNLAETDLLEQLDSTDPLVSTAKAYMGYAQARRITALTPEEIRTTGDILQSALEKAEGSDRDLAYAGALHILLSQATNLERAKQARQAADAWKAFDELYLKALDEVPNGLRILRNGLQRLLTQANGTDAAATAERIADAAEALAARARQLGDRTSVFEVVKVIGSPIVPEGPKMAADLLREYIDRNPNAILHRRALLFVVAEFDREAAVAEANHLLKMSQLPVSLESASQDETQVFAAQQLFEIDFNSFTFTMTPEEVKALVAKLEASAAKIAELARGFVDDSVVLSAQGKLAFVKGDLDTADARFDEVFRKGSMIDVNLYALAAETASRRGETGQAQQLINKGLELAPNSIELVERSASFAQRNGRFAEAQRLAESVLAREPNRPIAQNILAAAKAAENPTAIDVNEPVFKAITEVDRLRLDRKLDEARAVAATLIRDHPKDIRTYISAATVEFDAKNNDQSLALIEQALELAPDDPRLLRLQAFVRGGDDPVARLEQIVKTDHPNEPEQTVNLAIRFAQGLNDTRQSIERLKTSDPAESARLAAIEPAIEKAATDYAAKAQALAPTHPLWLDFRLSNALLDRDYPAAEAVITEAERAQRSPALITLFRGRLALTQGKAGEAITLLQRAIDQNIDDADVYRLLGHAQELSGDLQGAVRSHQEAYRRKSTDLNSAKALVSALAKSGDRTGALTILRDLRKIASDDLDTIETWLDLEGEIGDQQLARQTRASRYIAFPDDGRNARKLAVMLAERQPSREAIVDSSGRVKFTEAAWLALDDRSRQQEFDRIRKVWQAESDRIFADLIAKEPASIELAMVRSATYRRQGRYAEAESTLRGLIQRAGDRLTPEMWVALGVHFTEIDEVAKATEAFKEAQRIQDPTTRLGDTAISEYFFSRGDWNRAIEPLEELAKIREDRAFLMRYAETLARVGRYDDARKRLAEARAAPSTGDAASAELVMDQLDGSIADSQARALTATGDLKRAAEVVDTGLLSLEKAARTAPSNPIIPTQQAALLILKFEATGESPHLAAALAAADRGTKLRGDYWPASLAKSDILWLMGEKAASVAEIERFVRATPSNRDGRMRLIDRLAETGKSNRAIEVAREAIQLSPNEPSWHVALSSVYERNGQLDNAIESMERADRIRPSEEYLARATDLRFRQEKPNWQAVLASLRPREADVSRSPYLQSAIGVALANSGDVVNGYRVIGSSFLAAREAIAQGRARDSIIDSWFTNLRLVFPGPRTAEAEKFLYEISQNKPTTRELRWLAELYFASGPEGGVKVIEVAERALAADDKREAAITARLHELIGSVKYGQGDCPGALAAMRMAKNSLSGEASLLNNFAYLAAECGDNPSEAVEAASEANRMAPGEAEFLDTYGFALARAKRHEEALVQLQASIRIKPSASAHMHMAQVLLAMDRRDDATTHVRAAGDLKPNPMIQKQLNELIEKLR